MADTANEDRFQHSFAQQGPEGDGRLYAPAAARNGDAILAALVPHLPATGTIVEIASGTGEHVIKFAANTPHLVWQPTDIDPARLTSIAAWTAASGLKNIATPMHYDAVSQAWIGEPTNGIFLSNLTHLISEQAVQRLLAHMAGSLANQGRLFLYGPFKRGEKFVSEADQRFDATIRGEMPEAGYKDIHWIEMELAGAKLSKIETIAMPANNLLTIWEKA